jgi:hypothetical protein
VNEKYTDFQQRLLNAADAFYYAGILTALPFDALNVDGGDFRNAAWAAEAAAHGQNRQNTLGAPPIVNLGFSIELYIKLLWNLSSNRKMRGHKILELFSKLETLPNVSAVVIKNSSYARGCRDEFLEIITAESSVFDDWRYAHEKEFLCSSPDTLLMIAVSFRKTVSELYPGLKSAFRYSFGDIP